MIRAGDNGHCKTKVLGRGESDVLKKYIGHLIGKLLINEW